MDVEVVGVVIAAVGAVIALLRLRWEMQDRRRQMENETARTKGTGPRIETFTVAQMRDKIRQHTPHTVYRGRTGEVVMTAQALLRDLGYDFSEEEVSVFGPHTEVAVRMFQADRGQTVDGIVGPQTWAALVRDPPECPD